MSELHPRDQDYFAYQHMRTATEALSPDADPLNPKVSYAFAVQDQIIRCMTQGIEQTRITVGAALADIDARSQMADQSDTLSFEDFNG